MPQNWYVFALIRTERVYFPRLLHHRNKGYILSNASWNGKEIPISMFKWHIGRYQIQYERIWKYLTPWAFFFLFLQRTCLRIRAKWELNIGIVLLALGSINVAFVAVNPLYSFPLGRLKRPQLISVFDFNPNCTACSVGRFPWEGL